MWKVIYKTLRSVIFAVTLTVVGLYVLVYILFSIPSFTEMIKNKTCIQLSEFLGAPVEIEQLEVFPFNEVKISGLSVKDKEDKRCLYVNTLGAGVSLWKLIFEKRVILTYGEIIGLDANIIQAKENGSLNIDFIIEAFKSNEDNKEKKPFELALRNVVLLKSAISFRRPWMSDKTLGKIDLANLCIQDLAADISFPKISNEGVEVDLRRLSLYMPEILQIETLSLTGIFSDKEINIRDFRFKLPQSQLYIPEIQLIPEDGENMEEAIKKHRHILNITESYFTPSEFSFLLPALSDFNQRLDLIIKASGNMDAVSIDKFEFGNLSLMFLSFTGNVLNPTDLKNFGADIKDFNLQLSHDVFSFLGNNLPLLPATLKPIVDNFNFLNVKGDFTASLAQPQINGNFKVESNEFNLTIEGSAEKKISNSFWAQGEIDIESFCLQDFMPNVPVSDINAVIIADLNVRNQRPEGSVSLMVDNFEFKGKKYDGFSLNLSKDEETLRGDIFMENAIAEINGGFNAMIEGKQKEAVVDLYLERLNLSEITDLKNYNGYVISGSLNMDAQMETIDDLSGNIKLENLSFSAPDNSRKLSLKHLDIEAGVEDSIRTVIINSDWFDARAEGSFKINELPSQLMAMGNSVFPALINPPAESDRIFNNDLDFDILIKKNNNVPEFFNLPVRFLVPVHIDITVESYSNSASLTVNVPYLQQGKDKLIYDTKIYADLNGNSGILNALIQTNVPVKRGDLALNLNLFGRNDVLSSDIHFVNTDNQDFKGHITLDTQFRKNALNRKPEILLTILPSVLQLGSAEWNLSQSTIKYSDKTIDIDDLRLWHDAQFVELQGTASPNYSDVLKISLQDIDVDYIFEMLAINYVTFGGTATGEISGHALLSSDPVAETESLQIKEFSYNGAPLGTCFASSRWNNEQKEIEISADIFMDDRQIVDGSGGIWLGKDSLSFNISARKVPVEFVQPFMAVFSSHVGGYATGDVNLFGTFHDIDMTGKIFADSVSVKLDYTNTVYHGSDSVILTPGRINIPHFRLYDKFGNSAMLTGELTHRYFHDPSFNFRLSDASNFLCYDTNSDFNPDWYGTLFGSGSANLTGVPGITDISADMTVEGNSNFTFVLNDTQYARDYQFLTFSDKKTEESLKNRPPTVKDIKEMLKQSMHHNENSMSKFGIDIRATVTPQVLFTLVMDPAAGDKITARGRGAMQVKYESDNDEMMMYGKYEIAEGNYNFSLQDIILRDFKIKEGSFITFNGNPLAADLDISATYRVNTNLSDLDKSFSTDRDLNRTNVPVDAVLSVNGNMNSPDITFDIELPTLTQDVERKVKSIISTDDMMNRQIIYLLALNRFYTPEYMGAAGNGGELAAVASSTISSQLSNMLGQLTDKFSLAPSFRSDKGDFSDIEVDVALSSRLLNNRLLINGNFGYRDKATSSTTFVGDFDVEYLLSKNGNLRLKAYNHFNDQNYYLREALTTQGLGLVYRKDFDDWFKFLRKKDKPNNPQEETFEYNGTQD